MTKLNNNIFANIIRLSAVAATGIMLAFSSISATYAEDSMDFEIVKDGADGRFQDCLLTSGSTVSSTSNSISCTTPGGVTTDCDTNNSGADDQCSTAESGGKKPNKFSYGKRAVLKALKAK